MQNLKRITPVLEKVEEIWRQHPDWRLGQLISNLAAWAEESVWDIEEDVLVSEIDQHLKQLEERAQTTSEAAES